MDYSEAMNYIQDKTKLGIVPGLENIRELLRRLGNPQDRIKCLHIAGTNGKGSIFSFMEDILLTSGYRVGRYISPTIFTYLERFQIDKQTMCGEDFIKYIDKISRIIYCMEADGYKSPTAFEIETAIAFEYFKDMEVDYALIECGMGGLLDATNVIARPEAVVMASVSMDHMGFLGDTLCAIAENKSGIIKEGSLCVSHPQEPSVSHILKEKCGEKNADLFMIDADDIEICTFDLKHTEFLYKGMKYSIKLLGGHQVINASVAIELSFRLMKRGASRINYEVIERAVKNTVWPGRMTMVHDAPLVFVDGAHNEKAWQILHKTVNKYFTNRRIIYIIGVLKDKEYEKMLDILSDTMGSVVTVTPSGERGLSKETLAALVHARGIKCETADGAEDAIAKAMARAADDDVIIVCGSLSFISDYLTYNYKQGI